MRKTQNTIALLGGALLGAAAMYVLDPDMGKRRRKYIAAQAGDYFDEAGNLVRGGWETVRDRAANIGANVADKAADYRDRMSDIADDYRSRMSGSVSDTADDLRGRGRHWWNRFLGGASDYADDYAGRAGDLRDNVADYGNHLWNRVRKIGDRLGSRASDAVSTARHRMAGEEESSPVLPITLTGVGCCALGVGLMYLMDPQRGRARRSWLGDKLTSVARQTGRTFYGTGRDLANRAYGMAAETGGRFRSSGPVGSEQLLQRVRSEMGRSVSHPRLVQVMTDANGCVTLTGYVLANESDNLVATVESVPGVTLVVNRLETRNSEDELNRAAGSMQEGVRQL